MIESFQCRSFVKFFVFWERKSIQERKDFVKSAFRVSHCSQIKGQLLHHVPVFPFPISPKYRNS